ncbi:MAG: DUF1043 family protein [Wenzhouxiangellaceae bacterium]|nr:DUF1043 family protein [Wenzhouxiangellaceae bacterium]
MDMVIWLVIGLVVGGAIGAVLAWWWSRGHGGEQNLAAIKAENEQFRGEVNQHFVETARLINQLTDSYKAVFDHLSSGAEKLVDEKTLAEQMPRVSSREVRLRHLGKTGDDTEVGSGKGELKARPAAESRRLGGGAPSADKPSAEKTSGDKTDPLRPDARPPKGRGGTD